jgi:hypothetical protein
MQPQVIERLVDSHRDEALASLVASDVADFVVHVLNQADLKPGPANVDRLASLGITLARTGHVEADFPLLAWLSKHPSSRRVDIVAALLVGLWNPAYRSTPVDAAQVGALVDIAGRLDLDDGARYGVVLALAQVMKSTSPAPVKTLAAAALRTAALRRCANPNLDRLLQEAVRVAVTAQA